MHLKQLEMSTIVHHLPQFKTCIKKVSMNCTSKFNHQFQFKKKTRNTKRWLLTFCFDYWFVFQLNYPLISVL